MAPASSVHVHLRVRYTWAMAIEAVLQQVLKMPADERAELVEHLIDSLEEEEVEITAEELAHLDEAIADAVRAVERGELIPAEAVLAQLRQIS
jgi:putative addiction module component (TIGR02574 family)